MKVEIFKDGTCARVTFDGEMDEHSVKSVRAQIDEYIDTAQGVRQMVFDMKNVTFIDSTGLGFVFSRYKKLADKRIELLLSNVSKPVDKVFRTSGVYRYLPIIE